MSPRCYLDDDGEHFWFDHECADVQSKWAAKGHPLTTEAAQYFQSALNHTLLPIGPDKWQIVSKEPLTVSPSILCRQCGVHGFWQNDEWISA